LQDFVLTKFSVKSFNGAFAPFLGDCPILQRAGAGADPILVQGLLDPAPAHRFLQVVHLQQKDFSE